MKNHDDDELLLKGRRHFEALSLSTHESLLPYLLELDSAEKAFKEVARLLPNRSLSDIYLYEADADLSFGIIADEVCTVKILGSKVYKNGHMTNEQTLQPEILKIVARGLLRDALLPQVCSNCSSPIDGIEDGICVNCGEPTNPRSSDA